nr:hypothetical protein [Tanacetum cinerariifolium]
STNVFQDDHPPTTAVAVRPFAADIIFIIRFVCYAQ